MKRIVPLCLVSLSTLAAAQEAGVPADVSAPASTAVPAAAPAPAPAPVASTPAAPAPTTASTSTPAAKPVVASSEAKASDTPAEESSGGVQFHPGLSFGTVTVDGKTWTRLSLQPEIEIGKLGVALDLEVFLDDKQEVSSRGWEFGSTQEGLESILRKIYYVRWDKPGATFYARAGALDNVTMAHGLVVNGYRNTARYPDYKLLGLHTQLNDITSFGLDAELLVNSFQDFSKQGPFWAGRLGFRPLKASGMPIFSGLKVGAGVARDESQFSGLRDRDNDGCPDPVDAQPDNGSTCVGDLSYLIKDPNFISDTKTVKEARDLIAATEQAGSDSVASTYKRKASFTEIWVDASLPILQSEWLSLGVYTEYAKPFTPNDTLVASLGWGAIPLGAYAQIGPVDVTAEYRMFRGPFQPGWFDANYEIDRARQVGSSIVPKTELIYGNGASKALLQGYFAGLGVDMWGLIKVSGDYSQLVASNNVRDQRAMSGKVALGDKALGFVKQKVSRAELYWRKDRIGLDTGYTDEGVRYHDSFFGKSTYMAYGWRLGSQAAPGVELTVQRETTYSRRVDGSLKPETQMAISSQVRF